MLSVAPSSRTEDSRGRGKSPCSRLKLDSAELVAA